MDQTTPTWYSPNAHPDYVTTPARCRFPGAAGNRATRARLALRCARQPRKRVWTPPESLHCLSFHAFSSAPRAWTSPGPSDTGVNPSALHRHPPRWGYTAQLLLFIGTNLGKSD